MHSTDPDYVRQKKALRGLGQRFGSIIAITMMI
jgi:hypothetical protein